MPRFLVNWSINSVEDTAEAAAREALGVQRRQDSSALIFDVKDQDTGDVKRIDLTEIEPDIGPAP